MNHYQLAIIDFDGTLCGSHRAIAHTLRKTFDYFNVFVPNDALIHHTISQGLGLRETFIALDASLNDLSRHVMQHWIDTYRSIYLNEGLDKTDLYEGASLALKSMSESGTAIVVLSNKGEAAVNAALSHFQLLRYTQLVIGDRPNIPSKPNPTVFTEIIQPSFPEIDVSQVLVIGDTATDLEFAMNINVDACWVTYGYGQPEKCLAFNPKFVVHNLLRLKF